MSTDTAGAAFFDYLIDAVEQYTTENNLPWFSALGAISLLDTHLKNLMMSE
jgi:hypothetical protein